MTTEELRGRALKLVDEIEMHCHCGARPESLSTHSHVSGCPVAELKHILRPLLEQVAAEARLEEAKFWESHLRVNAKFWGWCDEDIKTPHPRIVELEAALAKQSGRG